MSKGTKLEVIKLKMEVYALVCLYEYFDFFKNHLSLERFIVWSAWDFLLLDSLLAEGWFFSVESIFSFNAIFQKKFSCYLLLFPFDSHHCWVMPRVTLLKSKFSLCNIAVGRIAEPISRGLGTCPFIRYRLNSVRDVSGTRVRWRSVRKYERKNQQL